MAVVDPRLAGDGLSELVALLGDADALNDAESVRACAQRLSLNLGSVIRGTRVADQWQSVIVAADDAHKLSDLLADVIRVVGDNTYTAGSLRAWMAREARPASMAAAVIECARCLKELRGMPDPREGEAQLIALSGSLAELVEGLDMPDIISIFGESADAPKTVAVIAAEARRASSAVDKLLVGVRIAPTALKRLGPSSSAVEIFASEFAIVGQLTDARSVVDEAITELLSALSNASPLFNLPRHADEPHS